MKSILLYLLAAATAVAATLNVPGQYGTIQLAIDAAQPGDTVLIAPGTYPENLVTKRAGTSLNKITIDGQNKASVSAQRMIIAHAHHALKNMKFTGPGRTYYGILEVNRGAHYTLLQDLEIDHNAQPKCTSIRWEVDLVNHATEASDCIMERILIYDVTASAALALAGARNTLRHSVFRDSWENDWLRLFGNNNQIHDNKFLNNLLSPDPAVVNHPDFCQTFGNNGEESYGHIIERNLINNIEGGQLFQLSPTGQPNIRDWTIRNNIFANAVLGGGGSTPGIKFYNNVFYRIQSPISFGSRSFGYRRGLSELHPIYSQCTSITPSGSLVAEGDGGQFQYGGSYEVKSFEVIVGIDSLEAGRTYRARTRGTGYVLYNGAQYTNTQTFVAQPGVTTWQELATNPADLESVLLFPHGTVVYDGQTFVGGSNNVTFRTNPAVRTYTSTWPEKFGPWRVVTDSSHRGEMKGNVFLECGNGGANTGWYGFEAGLDDCLADYNYVAGAGFSPKTADTLQRPIGAPGGWGSFVWWEPNGINGGNPGFVDFSNLDFRLTPTSILRDQGVVIAGVTGDFFGKPRPLGAAPDIGIDEYDDGSPPPVVTPGAPPAAPSSLTAAATGTTTATLGWTDNATNESLFEVERSLNGSTWVKTNTLTANSTSLVVTGLTASTTYYWRTRAVNGDGNSAVSNVANATTAAPPAPAPTDPPPAPTGFASIALGAHSIVLTWTNVATPLNSTGIEIACSPDNVAWVTLTTQGPTVTSWTNSGLAPSATYYYRARSLNGVQASAWSNTSAATTAATPPPRAASPRPAAGDGIIN